MNLKTRYFDENGYTRVFSAVRDLVLLLLAMALALAFWPLRTVPTGHRGVITVGGAIKGIEAEGFTLVAPWQNLSVFNVRSEQADIKDAEGATSDTQPVRVSMTVRYSVQPDKVAMVFEQFSRDGNLDSYITTATMDTFKAVTAKYTATDLIAKRQAVAGDIAGMLRQKVTQYGAQIINVDMTNFSFSPQYMAAINEKTTQEQLKLAAERKVATVNAEQQAKVAIAEAEATALKAKADGEAYSALKAATAQAEALRIQNAALAQNKDVLELRRIEVDKIRAEAQMKWDGKLPTAMYSGAPLPLLDLARSK